jgi:tRNA(Ile)-lysidine synthase
MEEATVPPFGPSVRHFDAGRFFAEPAEIALRLLGRAIAAAGNEGPAELAKLEALKQALDSAQNAGNRWRRSLAGALVTLKGGKIVVERAPPRRGRVSRVLTKHRPDGAGGSKTR